MDEDDVFFPRRMPVQDPVIHPTTFMFVPLKMVFANFLLTPPMMAFCILALNLSPIIPIAIAIIIHVVLALKYYDDPHAFQALIAKGNRKSPRKTKSLAALGTYKKFRP